MVYASKAPFRRAFPGMARFVRLLLFDGRSQFKDAAKGLELWYVPEGTDRVQNCLCISGIVLLYLPEKDLSPAYLP